MYTHKLKWYLIIYSQHSKLSYLIAFINLFLLCFLLSSHYHIDQDDDGWENGKQCNTSDSDA